SRVSDCALHRGRSGRLDGAARRDEARVVAGRSRIRDRRRRRGGARPAPRAMRDLVAHARRMASPRRVRGLRRGARGVVLDAAARRAAGATVVIAAAVFVVPPLLQFADWAFSVQKLLAVAAWGAAFALTAAVASRPASRRLLAASTAVAWIASVATLAVGSR